MRKTRDRCDGSCPSPDGYLALCELRKDARHYIVFSVRRGVAEERSLATFWCFIGLEWGLGILARVSIGGGDL